jgi:hypothetical protein
MLEGARRKGKESQAASSKFDVQFIRISQEIALCPENEADPRI